MRSTIQGIECLDKPLELADWRSLTHCRLTWAGLKTYADIYLRDAQRLPQKKPGSMLLKIAGLGEARLKEIKAVLRKKKLPPLKYAHEIGFRILQQRVRDLERIISNKEN